MKNKFTIKVKINSERPDFRVFSAYFFGSDLHNYDSYGNSFPVSSRNWTELYMCSRSNPDLSFEIYPANENPLVLAVFAKKTENAYRIAYFLAKETKGEVLNDADETAPLTHLVDKMGDFNLEERLSLADHSVWRKSTEENPYPNLNSL